MTIKGPSGSRPWFWLHALPCDKGNMVSDTRYPGCKVYQAIAGLQPVITCISFCACWTWTFMCIQLTRWHRFEVGHIKLKGSSLRCEQDSLWLHTHLLLSFLKLSKVWALSMTTFRKLFQKKAKVFFPTGIYLSWAPKHQLHKSVERNNCVLPWF